MFGENHITQIKKYLLALFSDRYFYEEDVEALRKLILLNYTLLAVVFFLVPLGIFSLFQGDQLLGILDLTAGTLGLSALLYYKKTKDYTWTSRLIIFFIGSLFIYLLFSGGKEFTGHLWSFTFPVAVMYLTGKKTGIILSVVFLIIIIIIFIIDPPIALYTSGFKLRFIAAFSALTVLSFFIEDARRRIQRINVKNYSELSKTIKTLEKKDKALKENELHYRTLFERANDSIFLMDGEKFIDCNPKTLEIFKCKKEEIINQPPYKFSPQFQPDGIDSKIKALEKINAALSGEHQFFEWLHCHLDGTTFYAEVSLDKIEIADRNLILASVRDISDRKKYEVDLLQAKEKAEHSDQLKSDFLAQMSHEIRTPINTIMNYTSLLKMEYDENLSEENKGSFVSIENAAHRLLRTIDLILNISDMETGSYEPHFEKIDLLDKILIPVINEFKRSAINKGLHISISKSEETAFVNIDTYTVYQTLANLIDNAIKYTSHGNINISLEKEIDCYVIRLSDTGVGISENYIPYLFEKFTQEEQGYTRKYEGSGLGLALVKKYCEINNINISVESTKGIGSTFTLKIPFGTI